jgi:cyclic pyranopterin phosphate synthase
MAKMVDIRRKPDVHRRAVASGTVRLKASTIRAVRAGRVEKGDPLAVAEVAALHAMKTVWQVLPHTHPVPITFAGVSFDVRTDGIVATTTVEATYKTGVEMEALYGATVALLTIWDMVKPLEKDAAGQYPTTKIEVLRVVSKEKGARTSRPGRTVRTGNRKNFLRRV